MADDTPLNTDQLIERYVKIRDGKEELEAEHKKKIARFNNALSKIEEELMKRLVEDGEDSKKTPHGTCYKTVKVTAKVSDRDAFLRFVEKENAWNFVESRVNGKEVEKYVAEHDELPPGVTTTRFTKVGVRRASTGE